jgi:hypothetical protein
MRNNMTRTFITTCLLFMSAFVFAQTPDSVKQALYKINKVFDSSRYLAFDVNIKYQSDTLLGKFEYEEVSGEYIVNNKHLYYKMGDIEYVQNDSFVYNIYNDEKMMMMTRDIMQFNSSQFPLREFVDSIIMWYDTAYSISIQSADESRTISFTAKPAFYDLPYRSFSITYQEDNYFPEQFEMTMYEGLTDLSDIPDSVAMYIKIRPVQKRITMSFSNYRNPQDLSVFDNTSYVEFDRQRKKYQPAVKFKAYKFFANGVDGARDMTIETYPPPPVAPPPFN